MSEALKFDIFAKDEFSKNFDKLTSKLPSVKKLALGAAAGVTALGVSLFAMAKTTATAYDKLGKFSQQTGLSTEFLSKMSVAANFADVNMKTLNKSLENLQVKIGEAAKGIGEGRETLEEFGIELYKENGILKTTEDMLPELADKFQAMTSATERTEAAQKLFGQRGIEMIKILEGGSEGLKEFADEAEAMGLVVSEQAAANAAEFNDALFRITGSLTGLKNAIGEKAMPYITALSNRFADFVKNSRSGIINFGAEIIRFIGGIMDNTAMGVAHIVDFWNSIRAGWLEVKIMFSDLNVAYEEMVRQMVMKSSDMLQAMNVKGIFDEAIASAEGFLWATGNGYDSMTLMGKQAKEDLNELLEKGLAVDKVEAFTMKVRAAIEEIRLAGEAEIEATAEKNEELVYQHQLYNDLIWNITKRRIDGETKYTLTADEAKMQSLQKLHSVGKSLGKEFFRVSQIAGIAHAWMNTAEGVTKALAAAAPPWNFVLAAAVGAAGAAQVANIASQKYAAHGGMTNVPREQTMLIDKDERILSPNQNKDFTDFISGDGGGGGGGVIIENINILPNATNAEMLLDMNQDDWVEIVENNIRPALKTLDDRGFAV